MRVGRLQALLHLLEEIFDLILDFLLESCTDLRKRERAASQIESFGWLLSPSSMIMD